MFSKKQQTPIKTQKSYYFNSSVKANWTDTSYNSLSKNGYVDNVIANRCINIIANCASSISLLIYEKSIEIPDSQVAKLIKMPNPFMSKEDFMQSIIHNLLISGNCYITMMKNAEDQISEMYILRSDRVSIVTDKQGFPMQYVYKCGPASRIFDVNITNGTSEVLHIKTFNPSDDLYGLSPLAIARFSIDQHNEAISWNKALLQNGARPSGALVIESNNTPDLTDEQFSRLKDQLSNEFTGSKMAGKIMLLEGGIKWQEMSISPKDMDFVETKNSAARDIALAFGVPSNLLGIQGDNTYSNFSEARLSLWEETVIPMLQKICTKLSYWISTNTNSDIEIKLDMDSISILTEKRYKIWDYVNRSEFLSPEEKKKMLGF